LPFLRRRRRDSASGTAVVADTVDGDVVVDDRRIVGVVHDCHIHVCDGAVIGKCTADPGAARESGADVAEAIVHAAIVADVRTPIACVERIHAANETPVTGCPQEANARWRNPSTGYPVVAACAPSPIAGGPQVAINWTRGLLVIRQWWRRFPHLDSDRSRLDHDWRGAGDPHPRDAAY